jgi:hypothetical protein
VREVTPSFSKMLRRCPLYGLRADDKPPRDLLVREALGLSFTNRAPGVTTYDYGSGATLGSTAEITLTGLEGPAAGPGSDVAAGYQRLTGTVVGFSPEGIPFVEFDGPVTVEHGRWPSFDALLAERCAALGGSLQL